MCCFYLSNKRQLQQLKSVIKEVSEKVSNLEKLAKNSSSKYEKAEKLFLELANAESRRGGL